MYVIWHHNIRVKRAQPTTGYRTQLLQHHVRDLGPAKINGSATGHVQQPIESDEGLARINVLASENALLREASRQPPRNKDGQSWNIQVGEAAAIRSHYVLVFGKRRGSQTKCGAKAPRGLKPALLLPELRPILPRF